MNICFIGVGGLGGYFGALALKGSNIKHKVYFIARGMHKEAICNKGLTLKKDGGKDIINVTPTLCTDKISEIPKCDIIIIAVKSYDLDDVAKEIVNITKDNTLVLPLLNGVDIYRRIRKFLKNGIVLPSCVYVGTHIESPGVIFQKGGSCNIIMGSDPEKPEILPNELMKLFDESGIDYSREKDVNVSIWSKYMFIAAYGLVCAANNKSVGEVFEDNNLRDTTKAIMCEIGNIAKKLNISLEKDIVESSLLKAKKFPYETRTSFQRDIETEGKKNEGDLFGGTIIRYGKELGVDTLNTSKVYQKLLDK